jgi:hypothetical protein
MLLGTQVDVAATVVGYGTDCPAGTTCPTALGVALCAIDVFVGTALVPLLVAVAAGADVESAAEQPPTSKVL